MQQDRYDGGLHARRALDRQIDRARRFGLDPVAEPAQRAVGVERLDGVVHSVAFANPETALGGKFLTTPAEDVKTAMASAERAAKRIFR